jgi:glycosyltransferase involved in cell wall biosynthesis
VNILFVNYGDFTTNSLNHIGGFAGALAARGHSCAVAVPFGKETLAAVTNPAFAAYTCDEILARPGIFDGGAVADIIHAWTPREYVRKFVLAYQKAASRPARLVVHLEDNEEHLVAGFVGCSPGALRELSAAELDLTLTDGLPHPVRHRTFLRLADMATVIVDRLREFVPSSVPSRLLPPGVDPAYLRPFKPDPELRRELGLAPEERVIVFTGSNTFANEPDMRDLYEAVRMINDHGIRTRLVRTGFNRPQFLESLTPALKEHVLDLGFIAKARLPRLLGIANVLVQPGRPGPFNDFRLPSKLPEFLASGRPVILPRTNIAVGMTADVDAVFLTDGSPRDIASCCERVFGDSGLAARLGAKGAAFAQKHFNLETNTDRLVGYYEELLKGTGNPAWASIRSQSVSDITAAAQELAKRLAAGAADRELATLAADLADAVRLDDEKLSVQSLASDRARARLEDAMKQLELQREMTKAHVRNLESQLEFKDRHLKLQTKLTDRHIQNLEARIAEVERAGAERIRVLSIETATASREHAKLVARILEMEAELRARECRLKAIKGSVSWKLAAPSRDIERVIRKLAIRLGWGPQDLDPPAPVTSAAAVAAEPTSASARPVEAKAASPKYSYTFNFDHPRTWKSSSNKLLILGWCYENSAAPITAIRAHFGDTVVDGIYGSKRLDVLASTGMRQAEYCGLKIEIPTHLGEHALVVEVRHEDGWNSYFQTLVHVGKPGDPTELSEYEKWCQQHEVLADGDLAAINGHIASFRSRPLISVVMPVYNTPAELLEKAIRSVSAQLYANWELCIADDASSETHVREILERLCAKDSRIKVYYRKTNGHICEATNSALALAAGEFVALFDHDDVLSPTALYEVAAELDVHPDAQFIYSDEDKIDMEDRRFDPYFKPDWNPDLNLGQNYTSHLSVYRTELIRSLGGFRSGFEGSQDWDLFLRAIERIPASAIRHIPKLLYHWRATPGSTALQPAEKSYPAEAARNALREHFSRRGDMVELLPVPGEHWRAKYPLPSPPPFVTLIIPTRNALQLVRQAVQSILDVTDYPNYEIVVVDNESDDPATIGYLAEIEKGGNPRVRVLRYHAPFNYSAINNFAVRDSKAQVVGLLNNDVEAIEKDWLAEMVSQACRPGIGAVGAMLYYPTNKVQHAGVVLGLGGVAGHPYKDFPRGDQGQKNRLRLVQNYSAVTAACLVIVRERFLEVGGLNEKDLPVAFNDVDLCCKLINAGYRNLWTPYAELYHHESATRGTDNTPEKMARFQSEIDYMTSTWGSLLMSDPAYNPNLTLVGEDFSPAYLSRTVRPWLGHVK